MKRKYFAEAIEGVSIEAVKLGNILNQQHESLQTIA